MKRIWTGIWIILVLVFLGLTINYISNERMISDYSKGEYSENKVAFLGFTEPYIAPYNQGNVNYKNGDYEKALEKYQEALSLHPSHDRECKIRTNIALCMVMPIQPDKIDQDDVDDVIETLESAKTVLMEHGCAHELDSDGHSKNAQKLKEDIDEFEKQLKQQRQPQRGNDNPGNPGKDDLRVDEEDIKKKLQDLQNQGMQERTPGLDYLDQLYQYDYYSGATW